MSLDEQVVSASVSFGSEAVFARIGIGTITSFWSTRIGWISAVFDREEDHESCQYLHLYASGAELGPELELQDRFATLERSVGTESC